MLNYLKILSNFITYNILNLTPAGKIAESINFFFYNTVKVYILLLIIGFFIGIVRCYITQEKTKKILSGKKAGFGNIVASFLAVITPVESFSTVTIFTGFLESGIPASIAFTYLITAPMTNEVAFALFWGLFGYKVALAYYAFGIFTGLIGGSIIGAIGTDKYIYSSVKKASGKTNDGNKKHNIFNVLSSAMKVSLEFLKTFWLYILIGIAIASLIQGYVPKELLIKYIGLNNPLAIPISVMLVIFFYLNIAIAMPIIMILVSHGLALGTIMAFTMAVTATSVPELLIMRKSVKTPLIIIYLVVLLSLIIISGYITNLLF